MCLIIFALALVGYDLYRNYIFDTKHADKTPSYTGKQFYNPYINALDYGIRFSPQDIGPNLTLAVEQLRSQLSPNPESASLIQNHYLRDDAAPDRARAFAEVNIFPFSPDQLIDRIITHPNWEYYVLLCEANDDHVMLLAALEIARRFRL